MNSTDRISPDPTVFIGIHGDFILHPWVNPGLPGEETFGPLYSRSTAMGWASYNGFRNNELDLWQVSEVEENWSPNPSTQIGWYQITLGSTNKPLPAQQIFACIRDCLGRVGTVTANGFQVWLPLPAVSSALTQLGASLEWFDWANPQSRAKVYITIDLGPGNYILDAAPAAFTYLRSTYTGPFVFHEITFEAAAAANLYPLVPDQRWPGPGEYKATFIVTIPEWTFDAAGWLIGMISESFLRNSTVLPILVNIVSAD